jgi:ankyrin repeat protein
MACANGHLDIIKLLVDDKRSNMNLKNYAGNTPLRKITFKFIIDWAAINGLKEIVNYLVEKGADITMKNNQNKVAAEEAYEKQYYDIAEFLVDKELLLNKGKDITEENVEMENELAAEIENQIKDEMDNVNLNK